MTGYKSIYGNYELSLPISVLIVSAVIWVFGVRSAGEMCFNCHNRGKRIGVSFHQEIPGGSLPVRAMVTAGNLFGLTPVSDTDHSGLLNRDIRFTAFYCLTSPIARAFLLVLIIIIFRQYKRIRILNSQ
jgi:hypothetical protein